MLPVKLKVQRQQTSRGGGVGGWVVPMFSAASVEDQERSHYSVLVSSPRWSVNRLPEEDSGENT